MLILQTIVFFFALLFTIQSTFQFIVNCVNDKNKYPDAEGYMLLAIFLWSLFFYLCHF